MKSNDKGYPEVWTYIVAAGKSADKLTCGVPFGVNNDHIFFGPCMKNYRKSLYEEYLKKEKVGRKDIEEDIYFLGMSGSKVKDAKKDEIRKILWFGKLLSVFTFESMHIFIDSIEKKELKTDFEKMRALSDSPLHIQPIFDNDMFKGYELRSTYHTSKWFNDIAGDKSKLNIINEKTIQLKNFEDRWEVFDKDCCLLFENLFSAEGEGLEIDNEILNIFKEHPKLSSRSDTITSRYFIYGKKKDSNSAIGLQGKGLKFKGALSQKLLDYILKKIQKTEKITPASTEVHKLDICK